MSMMVVVHRCVNETKTEHADNEYAFHWVAYTNNCFNNIGDELLLNFGAKFQR